MSFLDFPKSFHPTANLKYQPTDDLRSCAAFLDFPKLGYPTAY
jgi:hypothetical protein